MPVPTENESWIVDAGAEVIRKRANAGDVALSSKEQLIYWLWWADYMMRNAGDFANAEVLERDFQREAVMHATRLGLQLTAETFSLPRAELEREYLNRFELMCDEIRSA